MKHFFFTIIGLFFFQILSAQKETTFKTNGPDDYRESFYAFIHATIFVSYDKKIEDAALIIKEGKVDFLFIDGWHSINQVLDDWKFTEFLADGGVVGFHDTNCHPGPMLFVDNLNPDKYDIEKCCTTWMVDYGISFVSRK